MSFFLLAPVAFLTEGIKITPTVLQSAVSNTQLNSFHWLLENTKTKEAPFSPFMIVMKFLTDFLTHDVGSECKTGAYKVFTCCILFPRVPTG